MPWVVAGGYDSRVAAVPASRPATLVGQFLAFLATLNRPRDTRKAKTWAAKTAARFVVAAREHMVTVAAFTAITIGVFHASVVAGWIVLGVSLLLVEYKVRG